MIFIFKIFVLPIPATAGRYVREIDDQSHEINNFTSNHPPYIEESAVDGDSSGQGAQSLPVIAPAEPKARGECVGLRDDLRS